jgi:hypothetical protein
LFFRLGIAIDEEGPSIHKQNPGGFTSLIGALNKRLLALFDQRARGSDPNAAIVVMQEILKTPSKELKQLLLLKVIELSEGGRLESLFHFKFLSLWQKELKSNRTNELNQDEKKFHFDTQRLIKIVLPGLLDFLESDQAS